MAPDRARSGLDAVHPSRKAQVPGSAKPSTKSRRTKPPIYKKQAHASSVNAIKKRIRDVKRRLGRSDTLPATVRIEDERALIIYEQELAAANEEKVRQKMIKKYHMVRFFERKKATRQLKKLRKYLLEAQSDGEVTAIKNKMHVAEVDVNYTQYYPLYQRYVSLYPQKDVHGNENGAQDEQLNDSSKKPPLWAEVEKRMVDGTLDQLRNSSVTTIAHQRKDQCSKPPVMKSKAGTNNAKRASKVAEGMRLSKLSGRSSEQQMPGATEQKSLEKVATVEDADEESDGGFFE